MTGAALQISKAPMSCTACRVVGKRILSNQLRAIVEECIEVKATDDRISIH